MTEKVEEQKVEQPTTAAYNKLSNFLAQVAAKGGQNGQS